MSITCLGALHNLLLALLLSLAGCGGGNRPVPPPGSATINSVEYLVQSRHCDGNVATPLHQSDPITCRRFDFGHYQASDAFSMPDGSTISTWSYDPWGPLRLPEDGGEHYVIEGETARIDSTEDGGKPFIVQYFVGAACGGTGWVAFRNDATATPASLVARLTISNDDPNRCSAPNSAYTRYWTQDIDYPKLGRIPSVVGEHWGGKDIATAGSMERSFWGRGWGRLVWQAWGKRPTVLPEDALAMRCPDFDGFNSPPAPGWHLQDCREIVNVEPADGTLKGAQLWRPR